MAEESKDILPLSTPQETALDVIAAIAGIAPWIGGPIGVLLSGMSQGRKLTRVREVLTNMAEQIKDIRSEQRESYIKTEEFQELLERTLRQAADERHEEKRKAYANFLAHDIRVPGESYDEKIRFLQVFEQLQPDHIRMLKALLQVPDIETYKHHISGSISQTLSSRLPDLTAERISELADDLNGMRLTVLERRNTMMTASGAEQLRDRITPFGQRFLAYVLGG